MRILCWTLLALCSNLASAATTAPTSSNVPTIGVSAEGDYPVYKIDEVVKGRYFLVKGVMHSNGDLLGRMVIVSERDAASGRFKCEFLCRNSSKQVVGINPLYAQMIETPLLPALPHAPDLRLAHHLGSKSVDEKETDASRTQN